MAPTMGKARKGTKPTISLTVPTVIQLLGDCAERERTYSAALAKNITIVRAASD
jgi:hypothetical protein